MVQIISHYEGNSNFSCSRWSDHKLHPTLEKSLRNDSKKTTNICIYILRTSGRSRGYKLTCFPTANHTRSRSEHVCVCHLDFRISHGFSNLPEIRVQRREHRVLAGVRRLQVHLSGWASLQSGADLPEVHPARSLQGGQLVAGVGKSMKNVWGQTFTSMTSSSSLPLQLQMSRNWKSLLWRYCP